MYDRWVYHCFTGGRIWASLGKAGIRKSHTTLGEIVGLHNCAVADKGSIDKAGITKIAYDFREDLMTAQLYSCRHSATAVA